MARPVFTTAAYLDLEEIVRYVGERNPGAAARLTDKIEAQCWQIARKPGIGQLRTDLAPGLRFFPLRNYLLFYREENEDIHVIRIIHSARCYGAGDF
jgi:toxin ParE1/3/4